MEQFREQALLIFTVPVVWAAILVKIAVTHFQGIRACTWRETVTNFYMAALNGSLDFLLRVAVVLQACWTHRWMAAVGSCLPGFAKE